MTCRDVLAADRRAVWNGDRRGWPNKRFVHPPGGIAHRESTLPGRKTYSCSLPAGRRPFPADGWCFARPRGLSP